MKFSDDSGSTELYADGVASVLSVSETGFDYQGGWLEVVKFEQVAGKIDMQCRR